MRDKNLLVSYLSLFTSFGTILCCALPSLLVLLGMGSSFASLIGVFPQIVWFSENKLIVFTLSGVLIFGSLILLYVNRNAPCPIDPDQARACKISRRVSLYTSLIALSFWTTGFIFAYVASLLF